MLMSSKNKVARLHYMANSFRMLTAGDHVVCAETGQAIPLEELRYWSVVKQEPYVSADASVRATMKKS
ncbi:MAG: DUF2093 domain-containing protein [Sphingorhabdus sp.]|uniref:DUF2093 domain-containing protein n=1 Tax=Sphingorhabdus sp. TaxID=1902408 RepID=UPI00273DD2CC|nr:DUF2093 domain-containing protein [Sphingorhabdus sp.]MDP4871871.1 DUF2093 domain-containing protein [Sphingorhabdus sp.]